MELLFLGIRVLPTTNCDCDFNFVCKDCIASVYPRRVHPITKRNYCPCTPTKVCKYCELECPDFH